ncbi:Holliday junction resolvase RuvX [Halanaerobiaceae bacterium Z-7014]|uniref:Putative pre-16S rRNA nuclease n=1 Tax=Halonatronomonas betaini TaxID=2778430 RepID=A0A931ASD9_9FIRM|nr:Holliday junction resolvase RuvX [Halonatronomonas betaini]MBF8437597.1 Holliday junction resolvase RuvX [Halonatronomonas betaini]
MRVLAIDYGQKRVGLAISDRLGITAQPYKTIINESREELIEELAEIIKKNDITEVVIGLPLHMNGTEGERAEKSRILATELEDALNISVFLQDERLSSAEVEKVMLAGDLSRAKRRAKRDKLAASIILRTYLANRKGGN